MSNNLFNSSNVILWMILFCLSVRTSYVWCDEQPVELSPGADIKKVSAQTESKVEELAKELKSKDGDSLDTSPSMQSSQQTDYNYVVSKPSQPISLDLGPYNSAVQSSTGEQPTGNQYESQSHVSQQSPLVYKYSTGADSSSDDQQTTQQQSYIRQEPQHPVYEQKTYVRQALVENEPERSSVQIPSSGYQLPELPRELPRTQPGISSTYSSPQVKIVSHTRSFLPRVYNKPVDESPEDDGQNSSAEHEYDKAVEDKPGGSYNQQQDHYDSDEEGDGQQTQSANSGQPSQQSYENQNEYRNEDQRNSEVLSRGPYYNIHKPHVAHVQVIHDKEDYRNQQKEEYGGQSFGYRTQPRPQYKNYKPSGYHPGMLNQYDPPSPPLSALLPPLNGHSVRNSDSDDDSDYDSREQSSRSQHLPDPQALQQQSQSPQEYKQRPGVEIEFDQSHRNEPNVIRGPGLPERPNGYSDGSQNSDQLRGPPEQDYSNEPERPNDSYGNRGQDYVNNHLGPKYNTEGDDQEQNNYQRGRPQQMVKPEAIQYGFIPLSEAKDILGGYRGGQQNYREGPKRPLNRPNEGGYGPEGYREQRGYPANVGHMRRPPQFNGPVEGMGILYNRGQEGQRGGGYIGSDIYREQTTGHPTHPTHPTQPLPPGLNGYRKPQYERPPFGKNKGEERPPGYLTPYGDGPKDDDEEEVDGDDGDYGKQNKVQISADNSEDEKGVYDPNKLPYECYPWNCNPWHSVHPNSPYNSGVPPLKGRGPHTGSGLPPGASYNPRDVGLDEAVVAQLNLAASAPQGIVPGLPQGYRHGLGIHNSPQMDIPFAGSRQPFPSYNNVAPGLPSQRPNPRPLPYSANGEGFRSQYGYRAAASELSPVSAAQTSSPSANSPVLSNLLNLSQLNPVKSFRSLMSYLTGGING